MKRLIAVVVVCGFSATNVFGWSLKCSRFNNYTDRIYRVNGGNVYKQGHRGPDVTLMTYPAHDDGHTKTVATLVGHRLRGKSFWYSDNGASWMGDVDYFKRDFVPTKEELSFVTDPTGQKRDQHGDARAQYKKLKGCCWHKVKFSYQYGHISKEACYESNGDHTTTVHFSAHPEHINAGKGSWTKKVNCDF